MKSSENKLALLLTVVINCITSFTSGCNPPSIKRQRVNFSNPFDASSCLDIKKAIRLVKLLTLKEVAKQHNPNVPRQFLDFLYGPEEKNTQTDLDDRADKEVETILRRKSSKPEGILLKRLGSKNDTLYVAISCEAIDGLGIPAISAIRSLKHPSMVIRSGFLSKNDNLFYGKDGHSYEVTHL